MNCDICGKRLENFHFVSTVKADDDNVGHKYKFCQKCFEKKIDNFIQEIIGKN